MKKVMKVLIPLFICLMMFSTSVLAFTEIPTDTGIENMKNNASGTADSIIGAMQWIGYAVAVGMLVFVGIKYVMASANEKADLKNALIKYVIGAVLIAGAVTIAGWVFKIV